MQERIIEALGKLDVENDAHWTADGLPVIAHMKELIGADVTRAEITQAAKGFSRRATEGLAQIAAPAPAQAQWKADWASKQASPASVTPSESEPEPKPEPEPEPDSVVMDSGMTVEQVGQEDWAIAIEENFQKAKLDYHAAKEALRIASEQKDRLVQYKDEIAAHTDPATSIKQYQASQSKQRALRRQALSQVQSSAQGLTTKY